MLWRRTGERQVALGEPADRPACAPWRHCLTAAIGIIHRASWRHCFTAAVGVIHGDRSCKRKALRLGGGRAKGPNTGQVCPPAAAKGGPLHVATDRGSRESSGGRGAGEQSREAVRRVATDRSDTAHPCTSARAAHGSAGRQLTAAVGVLHRDCSCKRCSRDSPQGLQL